MDVQKYVWPLHPNDPIEAGGGGIAGVTVTVAGLQGQTNENGHWTGTASGGPFNMWLRKSALTFTKPDIVNIVNDGGASESTLDQQVTVQVDVPKEVSVARDETNVYYHVDRMHSFFRNTPYLYSDMDYSMDAHVHCGPYVNGGSDGATIGFGTAYGGDWARAADVIYHEYTHNVIAHVYAEDDILTFIDVDPFGQGEDAAMDEGFADYFACAKTSDPVHSEGVLAGDPYVRHLDNSYTMDDWTALGVQGGYHSQGQTISGACWDVRQALPGANINLLVFNTLFYHTHNFLDFANALVDADDDDDNLGNGTPHLSTIRQKFYARKIYFTAGPPQPPPNIVQTVFDSRPVLMWGDVLEPDVRTGGNILVERFATPWPSRATSRWSCTTPQGNRWPN